MAGGRPQKLIDVDFVDTFRDLDFTWKDIAELEVGYSTLMEWKRTEYLPEADHGKKRTAEEYTDAALDDEMASITSNKPSWGEVRVWGLLEARGIRCSRRCKQRHRLLARLFHAFSCPCCPNPPPN